MTTEERRSATTKQYRNILEQCKKCIAQYERDMAQNTLYPKRFLKGLIWQNIWNFHWLKLTDI